jgi:hypothetical protein
VHPDTVGRLPVRARRFRCTTGSSSRATSCPTATRALTPLARRASDSQVLCSQWTAADRTATKHIDGSHNTKRASPVVALVTTAGGRKHKRGRAALRWRRRHEARVRLAAHSVAKAGVRVLVRDTLIAVAVGQSSRAWRLAVAAASGWGRGGRGFRRLRRFRRRSGGCGASRSCALPPRAAISITLRPGPGVGIG